MKSQAEAFAMKLTSRRCFTRREVIVWADGIIALEEATPWVRHSLICHPLSFFPNQLISLYIVKIF